MPGPDGQRANRAVSGCVAGSVEGEQDAWCWGAADATSAWEAPGEDGVTVCRVVARIGVGSLQGSLEACCVLLAGCGVAEADAGADGERSCWGVRNGME